LLTTQWERIAEEKWDFGERHVALCPEEVRIKIMRSTEISSSVCGKIAVPGRSSLASFHTTNHPAAL
jgi:hypothetical protein